MPKSEWFHPIIDALVRTVLWQIEDKPWSGDDPVLRQTMSQMRQRFALLPGYLHFPTLVLLNSFDWFCVLRTGKRFQDQSSENQLRYLRSWKESPLGPCRDFVRFQEKMTIFVFYSQIQTLEAGT